MSLSRCLLAPHHHFAVALRNVLNALQDYLQASCLSKVIVGQIKNEPEQLLKITLFMRSPRAGAMFASSFAGILWYDALYRLACLMSPVHERLLKPFPALLFRWRCLLSQFKLGSANDYEEPASP